MAKVSNTDIYKYNLTPSILDYLLGTDAFDNKKTKSFKIRSLIQLINGVNGKNVIQFEFSDGSDPEKNYNTIGSFFTDTNEVAVGDFTKLIFNKSSLQPLDLSLLFNKLGTLENVVLKLENPEDPQNFFNLNLVAFVDHTDYFELEVQSFNDLYLGNLINLKTYSLYFFIASNGAGGSTPDATESTKGKAQIATEAETISGVNDTKIVTPAKLAAAFTDRDLGYSPENVDNKTNTVSGNETSTTLYPSVKGLVDWIASRGFITSVITALGYTPENSANKGAANGYVPLNSSTKIDTTYLPDSILGQLLYGGVVDASTAIATLTNNAKSKLGTGSSTITLTNNTTAITGYASNEGIYYIATVAGTFAGISFEVGDWLVSIGSAWKKIDNTDAISSFNTRTGAIVLLNTDVLPLVLSGLSAASGTFTSTDTILTAFGKIKYLIDNIATTYQPILTDVNFGSFSNGLTGKTTPVDADSVNIVDSADSNKAKKVSLTNFKSFLKTYFDGLYSVPCITITTSSSIDTDTTGSGYGQHGRNTKIANSTNAINLTVQTTSNADFVASYTKIGSATITFVAGSGTTLVQLSGTAALTGSVGSTATLTRHGNTYYLQITNY